MHWESKWVNVFNVFFFSPSVQRNWSFFHIPPSASAGFHFDISSNKTHLPELVSPHCDVILTKKRPVGTLCCYIQYFFPCDGVLGRHFCSADWKLLLFVWLAVCWKERGREQKLHPCLCLSLDCQKTGRQLHVTPSLGNCVWWSGSNYY